MTRISPEVRSRMNRVVDYLSGVRWASLSVISEAVGESPTKTMRAIGALVRAGSVEIVKREPFRAANGTIDINQPALYRLKQTVVH